MIAALAVAQAITLAALAWLAWRYRALRMEAVRLAQSARDLAPVPASAAQLLGADKPEMITIEVLNAIELAQRESALAGTLGKLAPTLVRAEVYKRVRAEVEEGLKARGVAAEVKVQRAP